MKFKIKHVKQVIQDLNIDMNKQKFTIQDLKKGMIVENEHFNITHGSIKKTAKIALAHLNEDPKYYQKLTKIGLGTEVTIEQLQNILHSKVIQQDIQKAMTWGDVARIIKKVLKIFGVTLSISLILKYITDKSETKRYWNNVYDFLLHMTFSIALSAYLKKSYPYLPFETINELVIQRWNHFNATKYSGSGIQSIMFPKSKYTSESSFNWLQKHNMKPLKKVHETENYYRYRIEKPNKNNKYYTMKIKHGIQLVIQK